ncbi:hypothetical protein BKG83_00190 [Mycobacteroides chelonae]|jgi:hypothetical protein|nr:hypothetical protein BKG83_00190 [Mycobacteroides chelonae]PKQ56857.1 hypothetical protein B5566_16840 [Mycobacterium sp. MHSD3]SKN55088.1 Uncharacterised protein [Mycobacteroides abscessus subsp. bolletii]
MPSEGDYQVLLERVRTDLVRLSEVPVAGETTSPIEQDDKFLRALPISHPFQDYVRLPLHSALDNLGLVAETLNTSGPIHLYAEKSLIRTSLTTASWALWILDLDQKNRRSRALRFAFKNIDGLFSYFRNDPTLDSSTDPNFLEGMDRIQGAIVDCANDLEGKEWDVNSYRHNRTGNSDTAVVRSAGIAIGATDLLKTWQFMSGYAHGLPWAALVSAIATPIRNPIHGIIIPMHTPNAAELLAASNLALTVIEKSIGRFEILTRAPT